MQKLSAQWVPKCLNADQKHQWCQSSEQLSEFFWHDPNDFLSGSVTTDETWLYHYDPETKQQSMEWRNSGSPCPKKFRVQKSGRKVLTSIFWDQDGILLKDYFPKGWTINAEYYSSLLVQLKDILKEKCHGKVTKSVLFLHNNAMAHRALATQKTGLPQLPMSWSPALFPGSGPVGLPPVPWTEKNNWKVAIFHPTRRSLLPQRPGWIDNLLNFFWVACKSYSNRLRSVLSFMGSTLNKSQDWLL